MSQSDTWLLIYGREMAKYVMSKSSKFPKKWFRRRIKIFVNYFKGLAVFSVHKRTLSII